jgi:hypothetical protein
LFKLTTFVVVELFFLYNLPTIKTLCDLTNSCCYKTPPFSHTHMKNKHQKIKGKQKKRCKANTKRMKERKNKKRKNKE